MLQLMREKFKHLQWILWAVIFSFVAWIFVAWGMGRGGGGGGYSEGDGGQGNIAIEVDGRAITRNEVVRQVRDLNETYRTQFAQLPPEQVDRFLKQMRLREQVRTSLVQRQVALREAAKAGLSVSESEVRDFFIKNFVDGEGNFIGRERLARVIRQRGYSEQEFRATIANDILLQRLRTLVEAGAVVSDAAVKTEYLKQKDEAKVEYVWIDQAAALDPAAPAPGEAELRSFYAAHPDLFAREERKAAYVFFPAASFTAKTTASPSELKEEYETTARFGGFVERRRARHILLKTDAAKADPTKRQEIERRATEIAGKARNGEDFATLARTYSEDAGSRESGGDLGFFARGAMVKPFEEATFAMTAGEVRGPVESDFGYHVIQLVEIQPAKSLEQATPELEAQLKERKALELARAAAVDAIAKHQTDGDLAAMAATGAGAPEESPFLPADAVTATIAGIDPPYVPGFVRALFALHEPGTLAPEPLAAGGGFAVLKLREKRGPITPPFDAERAAAEVKTSRGREAVRKKLVALEAALGKGKTLSEAAAAAGVETKTSAGFHRGGTIPGIARSEEAAKVAYELEVGKVSRGIELAQGTVVLRVTERFAFDPVRFEAEKDGVRATLASARKAEMWSSLLRAAQKDLEDRKRIRFLLPDLFVEPDEAADAEAM
jgi:peptidyl-prolyl cis-trans isomerase D